MSTSMTTRSTTPARRAARGGAQRVDVPGVVDRDDRVGRAPQPREPLHLQRRDELVRDEDVAYARGRGDLGLAELGAGDADRAGRDRAQRDRRDLDALEVRPPGDACRAARAGDGGDVGLHAVEVDQQHGRVEFGLLASDAGDGHRGDPSGGVAVRR
jgi:hypothetical protein